jgi:hypothetical protein
VLHVHMQYFHGHWDMYRFVGVGCSV